MGRFFTLLPVLLLALGGSARAQDPTIILSLTDASGSPAAAVEVSSMFEHPWISQGWSWGVCHDWTLLHVESATHGTTTATINNGSSPDFAVYELYPDGWTVGVVISFQGQAVLPPGSGYELAISSYELVGDIGTVFELWPPPPAPFPGCGGVAGSDCEQQLSCP